MMSSTGSFQSFSVRVEGIGDLLITNVLSANSSGGPGGRCGQTATKMNQISCFIDWKSVGENFYFGGRGLGNKGDGLIS